MHIPEGLLCSRSHSYLWELDSKFYVGITDVALKDFGDVVSVELPEVGSFFEKEETFATVETIKQTVELSMPVAGTIKKINEEIIKSPEILNESPYEHGWLLEVSPDDVQADAVDLLEYEDYVDEMF